MHSSARVICCHALMATAAISAIFTVSACGLLGTTSESAPTQPPPPVYTATPTSTPTPQREWSVTTLRQSFFSIEQITLDLEGNVWSVGSGGVTRWDLETGLYDTFSIEDGMPIKGGIGLLTDTQGQIWVRWDDGHGVSRYSQGVWTHYDAAHGLADNNVRDMGLADDGMLWFATAKGISSFDGETWVSYTTDDGLPSNDVKVIEASQGAVWAATDAGVTSFDGSRWIDHNRLLDITVHDIAITQGGRVWFATSDRMRFFEDDTWYFSAGSGTRLMPGGDYYSFAVATDGTLWAKSLSGLAVFNGSTWYWFTQDMGLPTLLGQELHAMQDGSIWIPTIGGLLRLSDWEFFDAGRFVVAAQSICTGQFGAVLQGTFSIQDLENLTCLDERSYSGPALEVPDGTKVFVATQSYGKKSHDLLVIRETGEYAILSFAENERDPNLPSLYAIRRVLNNGEAIWFDSVGLYRLDSQGWQNLSLEEPSIIPLTMELGPQGQVWVGSMYHVSIWDDLSPTLWAMQIEDGSLEELYVRGIGFYEDDAWVLDRRGLSRLIDGDLEAPTWITIEPAAWEGMTGDGEMRYLDIDSQGGIWIGGEAPYPAYYDGAAWTVYPEGLFEGGEITALAVAPDDSVWIGIFLEVDPASIEESTDDQYRLMHFDGNSWMAYEEAPGLPDAELYDILVTPDYNVWVAYQRGGIVRYDGSGTDWEVFNSAEVLGTSEIAHSISMDADGTLWFGLSDGFARYGTPEE